MFVSAEQYTAFFELWPKTCLTRMEICNVLSDYQFNWCINKEPQTALSYVHVCDRMTDIQLENTIKLHGGLLIRQFNLEYITCRLSPYMQGWLNQRKYIMVSFG
jgi:hypothetical protein